eukprot:1194987-Prorocentrum_minimum.AAC.3
MFRLLRIVPQARIRRGSSLSPKDLEFDHPLDKSEDRRSIPKRLRDSLRPLVFRRSRKPEIWECCVEIAKAGFYGAHLENHGSDQLLSIAVNLEMRAIHVTLKNSKFLPFSP